MKQEKNINNIQKITELLMTKVLKVTGKPMQYNTNQIYNVHKVTLKCESEMRIVSHQVKIQLTFQFHESQEEIESFEPHFERA